MDEVEFTTADEVAMRAIECGLSLLPWQFTWLDVAYQHATSGVSYMIVGPPEMDDL